MTSAEATSHVTGDAAVVNVKWTSRPYIKKTFSLCLRWLVISTTVGVLYGTVIFILGAPALPGGQLFAVTLLLVLGTVAAVVAKNVRLPSLLGPLVAGVLLRSTGAIHLEGEWQHAATIARKVALLLILLRAGLGLDVQALRSRGAVLFCLAVIPSAAETLTVMAASYWLLRLPWMWGAMAGAMIAAVSPAVVVPALVRFQEQGLGVLRGVPSLLVGGTAISIVLAVIEFEIVFALVFAQGNSPWEGVKKSLLALPIGVGFGLGWGAFVGFVRMNTDSQTTWFRSLLLLSGGMFAVFGGRTTGFNASGPIAAPISAIVAGIIWNRRQWPHRGRITTFFRLAWMAGEVLVFALIGADVNVTALQPKDVGLCTTVLGLGVLVRLAITVVVSFAGEFVWREKLFMALAGFPKATTQAALGPAALDASRRLALGEDAEAQATLMLTLAALSILLTAPLGAVILDAFGPRLLRRPSQHEQNEQTLDPEMEALQPTEGISVRKLPLKE